MKNVFLLLVLSLVIYACENGANTYKKQDLYSQLEILKLDNKLNISFYNSESRHTRKSDSLKVLITNIKCKIDSLEDVYLNMCSKKEKEEYLTKVKKEKMIDDNEKKLNNE